MYLKRDDYKANSFIKASEISSLTVVPGRTVFNRLLHCGFIESTGLKRRISTN